MAGGQPAGVTSQTNRRARCDDPAQSAAKRSFRTEVEIMTKNCDIGRGGIRTRRQPPPARRKSSRSASSPRCRGPPLCSGSSSATVSSWRSRPSAASSAGATSSHRRRTTNSSPTSRSPRSRGLVERDKVDFVVGPIFSNILAGDHQAGDRCRRIPDQPQRRHVELRRQGVQPQLVRHLLSERPDPRGARQIRAGQGHQEGLPDGAELSGRQGRARRLQALLQRRDRGRSLRAARPARLFGGARRSPRPRRMRSSRSCPAAWA